MDVQIGSSVSLRFEKEHGDVEGVFVGLEEPNFLIVRLSKEIDKIAIEDGQFVKGTYISLGTIYKIQANVLGLMKRFNIALLSYPTSYESVYLRKESRINCQIPATANIERKALKGLITDISYHGCQFLVKVPTTLKPHRVSVLTDINLSLSVLGQADPTLLKGKVRNTCISEFRIELGIEFDTLEERDIKRLEQFIEPLRAVQ